MGSQQLLTYRPLPGTRLNMAHPLAKNMVLCMLFNEQGSRAVDLSPSGAHGRLSGFGSPAKRHISGLDFVSATPSYVEIPAAYTQLNFTSEKFSGIVRLKVDSVAVIRTIFLSGEQDVSGYWWFILTDGSVALDTSQLGAYQRTNSSASDIVIATRYTIGFSRDGTSVKLYVNGVDVNSTVGDHTNPATSTDKYYIGYYKPGATYPFDGKIEFLRVFGGIALPATAHLWFHNALK